MPVPEGMEQKLRVAVMRADLDLQQKQSFWETPRNIVILLVVAGGIAAVTGFMLGQTIAEREQPRQIIIQFAPGSIVAAPAPAQ